MAAGDQNIRRAIGRGLWARCPNCGKGRLFAGYLRVVERCSVCQAPLGNYRAADGPAFITITVVGLLLVPALGWSFVALRPDPLKLALSVGLLMGILTLVCLRLSKGMMIGYLWATDERDSGA
ncbi:DUF983 domain-containing protein [bacterium]|nr:DUF983 domain-containing protein [bacterium]